MLPLDALRREFDVNVFGALSVMNAFLPALRPARGRIVQIGTWTASLPLPFNGPSGASKAAMEVFATVCPAAAYTQATHGAMDVRPEGPAASSPDSWDDSFSK